MIYATIKIRTLAATRIEKCDLNYKSSNSTTVITFRE